tara:strand:- start:30170 stop:30334 length:165 start_codon:yes stop_codon:yes gene_type:complete
MRNRVEALEEVVNELQREISELRHNQAKLVELAEKQAERIKTLEERGFIRKILG